MNLIKALIGLLILSILLVALVLTVRVLATVAYPRELTAAFIAIVTAFAAQGITNYFQKRREIEADQRKYKAEVYAKFTNWVSLLAAESAAQQHLEPADVIHETAKESSNLLNDSNREIVLWGSDEVLQKYIVYVRSTVGRGNQLLQEIPSELAGIEDLILSFRRDLGFRNKGIATGYIIGMYVNNLHDSTNLVDKIPGVESPGAFQS